MPERFSIYRMTQKAPSRRDEPDDENDHGPNDDPAEYQPDEEPKQGSCKCGIYVKLFILLADSATEARPCLGRKCPRCPPASSYWNWSCSPEPLLVDCFSASAFHARPARPRPDRRVDLKLFLQTDILARTDFGRGARARPEAPRTIPGVGGRKLRVLSKQSPGAKPPSAGTITEILKTLPSISGSTATTTSSGVDSARVK